MEKELQQAIENANRLRRELPHLVQPSKSDIHMVLLHDYIKDITANLARLMAELERTQSECERLRKDAERLRDALKYYGTHSSACDMSRFVRPTGCTCGYGAAIAAEETDNG